MSGTSSLITLFWDGTNISVRSTGDFSGRDAVVIMEYTKSTDTATRGGEQLRSMNTGALVGSGEKSNLLLDDFSGDSLTKTEDKTLEPLETKALTNDETESGESI